MNDFTHYEILSVSPDASFREIQEAYLLAAFTYREDSLATYSLLSPDQREQMQEKVQEAFEVLRDPDRRSAYDRRIAKATGAGARVIPLRPKKSPAAQKTRPPADRPVEPDSKDRTQPPVSPSTQFSLSSGQYLKYVRKMRNLSVQNIAQETRISVRYLEALEAEDYKVLPQGAYLGFLLRAYAKALGLEAESVVEDFKSRRPL